MGTYSELPATTVANLVPVTDGTSADTGDIGEILSASQATATSTGVGSTGTFGAVTSKALTAGVWWVTGVIAFKENGATLTTSLSGAITASATAAGITTFVPIAEAQLISGTADLILAVPHQIVSISTTTTYYLNSRIYYTAGSPQHYGEIKAYRIR